MLILFYAHANSLEWGLFGHFARSAFRRTPSGHVVRSQLESDLIQLQKAHRKPTDVLEISYGGPETSREFEGIIRKRTIGYKYLRDILHA